MSEETSIPTSLKVRWFFGILAAFAIFLIVAIYSSSMSEHVPSYDEERARQRLDNLAQLKKQDHETLTTADWVDQGKGVVRIPIDEAMAQEVDTLKAKPVQIANALPAAAAPAVANTLPATNAAPAAPAQTEPGKPGRPAAPAPAVSTNAAPTAPPPPATPNTNH